MGLGFWRKKLHREQSIGWETGKVNKNSLKKWVLCLCGLMGAILNISFGRSPLLILSFRRSPFWPKTLFLKVVVQIPGSLIQVHKSLCSFSTLFSTYSTCFGKWIIKVVDGPFSSIAGQGIVQLNPTLVSKSIWHVPNLSYNLQSIGNHLHCSMLFTSFGRIF